MAYGVFEIDGKVYSADRPLECTPWREEPIEYSEPVTAFAEPNTKDAWQARESWL